LRKSRVRCGVVASGCRAEVCCGDSERVKGAQRMSPAARRPTATDLFRRVAGESFGILIACVSFTLG
jgi:hypothetical protein